MKIFGYNIERAKAAGETANNNELFKILYERIAQMGGSLGSFSKKDKSITELVNDGYILNPHVHAVVGYALDSISQVPFGLFEVVDMKAYQRHLTYKHIGCTERSEVYFKKALEPTQEDDLERILKTPNEFQSFEEFLIESVGFHMLTGNDYTYGLESAGFGVFTQLYKMPAQLTSPVYGSWREPIKAYKLEFNNKMFIEREKVSHRKRWNPNYTQDGKQLVGVSPLTPLCNVVQRSNDSLLASLRMITNGYPAGILSNDANRSMKPEQVDAMEDAFHQKFGGAKNKNKVMFTASQVKWHQLGMTSVDMELDQSQIHDKRMVCEVYGIPSVLVSDQEQSTYNNVVEAEKRAWTRVFIPQLNDFTAALNNFLMPAYNERDNKTYVYAYDLNAIAALQTDLDKLSSRLLKERESGLWTANQVRAMLDREQEQDIEILNKYVLSTKLNFIETRDVDQKLDLLRSISPLLANKILESLTEDEVRTLLETNGN